MDSIMHYDSDASYLRDNDELRRVQLAKWRNRGPDFHASDAVLQGQLEELLRELEAKRERFRGYQDAVSLVCLIKS